MGNTREKLNDISDLVGKLRAYYPAAGGSGRVPSCAQSEKGVTASGI